MNALLEKRQCPSARTYMFLSRGAWLFADICIILPGLAFGVWNDMHFGGGIGQDGGGMDVATMGKPCIQLGS